MKTNRNTFLHTLLIVFGLSTLSCTKDFTEINIDPVGKKSSEAHQLLAPALVNILNANMSRNWSFNNQLMQVTVEINDSEGRVFRYDVRRTWADYTWNNWYVNLTDLKDIYAIASKPEKLNKSYQAISLITQTWGYSLLTDTYGDVPYSEANMGKVDVMEPAFDKQKDIYADMFKKLEEANQLLKAGTAIVGTSDPVYQGDLTKWRRFGNSLYLRLLLRASGKAEVSASVIAKIKEMIDTNPAEYPIIENNTQTAKILWNGTNSSTAVYSSPFMVNIRAVDFRSMPICDFFLGKLVAWDDPRVLPALGTSGVPRFGIDKGADGYVGIPSGSAPGSGMVIQAHFNSDAESKLTLQTDKNTGIIMNSAEVNFILAEAAAKGWINNPAENYYYKGMFEAINYWMPTYLTGPTDAKFISYVTNANLTWNAALPLESTTLGSNSKMEMIHIQKYYAMFLVDFQQWFEYRRTGHPILPKGTGLANGGKMPARLNYPLVTQSTNPTSYKNAIAVQGPDDINTLVWWQKP
ncbi:SusD/RagB family nutrient-binding outer membrane lipoprotein [Pedobacter sp. MC2016-14]|uniref:SusD/RagB family nutrient-binding outer membrane lipoprotein n=1 Tax=Pedobacter sp. MC2016-14 TaxID=2897327 RepID=UPI001E5B7EF3|nr:SusD/RagB family nutrient-binding outer membrane lipoprotein [Pedobacter sp. MC2016-14]MCD0488159.1 SusD/RagB family nutrient-binding outer membrane lipoprotein [Pedobacter sp. MC2016-14]